jgi:hypothetical protein
MLQLAHGQSELLLDELLPVEVLGTPDDTHPSPPEGSAMTRWTTGGAIWPDYPPATARTGQPH